MKTILGIWAFGAMATRFNPGGYKPELTGASTADKVRTAVEGLGDLIDDYEFHYPQELTPRQPRRGAGGARRARHLRGRDRHAPQPALRQGRRLLAGRRRARRGARLRRSRRRELAGERRRAR